MSCVMNPAVGRERDMAIVSTARPKKVMVVGGGPAGLEAARTAALRGHAVTVYDKENKLGGQLNLAAVPPAKQEMCKITKYLSSQAEKAGVAFSLNSEVTAEFVEQVKPDVVIIATGGAPCIPAIPGIEGDRVVSAQDLLADKVDLLPGKVMVIGGGMVGCETAEWIADRGDNPLIGCTDVTIVEMVHDVALDLAPQNRALLMQRLREKGVKILTFTKVIAFLDDGVVVEKEGQQETIHGIDKIILSLGVKPVDVLSDKIKTDETEVYVIGDAKAARKALDAIAEGAEIGRKI